MEEFLSGICPNQQFSHTNVYQRRAYSSLIQLFVTLSVELHSSHIQMMKWVPYWSISVLASCAHHQCKEQRKYVPNVLFHLCPHWCKKKWDNHHHIQPGHWPKSLRCSVFLQMRQLADCSLKAPLWSMQVSDGFSTDTLIWEFLQYMALTISYACNLRLIACSLRQKNT